MTIGEKHARKIYKRAKNTMGFSEKELDGGWVEYCTVLNPQGTIIKKELTK